MQMTEQSHEPRETVERWLDKQRFESSESTIETNWYRLKLFVEWCDERDIDALEELTTHHVDRYDGHRRGIVGSINSLKNELVTLRLFLRYCASLGVVDDQVAEHVDPPHVPASEQASDVRLETDDAAALLSYYRNSDEFGCRRHVLLELFWHTGARLGAIRGLDVEDLHEEEGTRYVFFRHRPESDTPLKKADNGERPVALPDAVGAAIQRYITVHRDDVTDDVGREPLITSMRGRPSPSSFRDWIYQATIPCLHSDCPHDRDPETCEWTGYGKASNCPSSRSPHQIRTGSITWMRNRGIPAEVVAERVNASVETIEQHYDKEDELEEMLKRRAQFTADLDISTEVDTDEN